MSSYGGRSLHEQSHGESFLAVLIDRFGPNGLYLLDEPEAALSPQNCLACLARIHDLVIDGSQLVIATHSPIVLAYPDAIIYECDVDGLRAIAYDEAVPVRLMTGFLADRTRYLTQLFGD
jgi:predicted ATPase